MLSASSRMMILCLLSIVWFLKRNIKYENRTCIVRDTRDKRSYQYHQAPCVATNVRRRLVFTTLIILLLFFLAQRREPCAVSFHSPSLRKGHLVHRKALDFVPDHIDPSGIGCVQFQNASRIGCPKKLSGQCVHTRRLRTSMNQKREAHVFVCDCEGE